MLVFLIVILWSFIENFSSDIPGMIHNVGIGIISIFLTAILLIFTAIQEEMQSWDRVIILEKVINAKWSFIYFGFLFFPPFIWGFHDIGNVLILLIFILTVFLLFPKLHNIYKWIVDIEQKDISLNKIGYRQKLREEFLREKGSMEYKTKIWSLTWSKKDINPYTEKRLMEIFFEESEDMAEKHDWKNLADWLYYFNAGKEKRNSLYWENTRIAVSHMLNINHGEYEAMTTDKPNDKTKKYVYASSSINDLLNFFISKALYNNSAYILFETLKEHLEGKEEKYQEDTISKIYETLFETIPLVNRSYTIWDNHFPREWKVTEENLEKNHIAYLFSQYYKRWLEEKIRFENKWDRELICIEDVSKELFPLISQRIWSEIINYLIRPYGENRGEELFRNPPKFGRIDNISYAYWESETTGEEVDKKLQKEIEERQKNTIPLVVKCFAKYLIPKEIEKTIQQLNSIELKNEQKEEKRRKKLLDIFEKLLSKIKERENANTKK